MEHNNILLILAAVMFCLLYIFRWRRRNHTRREARSHNRRNILVFNPGPDPPSVPRGQLDPTILASLPVLNDTNESLSSECVVCITEFKLGERVRLLPKCKHCFHIECIDMWFNSHATCPLCRSVVNKVSLGSGTIWKRMLSMGGRTPIIAPSKPSKLDLECGVGDSNQQQNCAQIPYVYTLNRDRQNLIPMVV